MTQPELAGYFITGSDTDVGKTWIGCQLIHQLSSQVKSLKVRKPIESGCEVQQDGQLFAADGNSLFEANGCRESPEIITPYRFRAALAPDRAASLEGKIITVDHLTRAIKNNIEQQDTLVVEGAGGFYSPIAQNALNADLAMALGLDVIIVIEDRLGAINQALLTINAVQHAGLEICAIVLNQATQNSPHNMDNLADLSVHVNLPVYKCAYQGQLPKINFFEAFSA